MNKTVDTDPASQPLEPVVCEFDRYLKHNYLWRGIDELGLKIELRKAVAGMTEEQAMQQPVAILLRFNQPADLLDLARDCLQLAAAGYRDMNEERLAHNTEVLCDTWPLGKR